MHFPVRTFIALFLVPLFLAFIEYISTKKFGKAGLILPIVILLLTPQLGSASLIMSVTLFIIYFTVKSIEEKKYLR